MRVEVEDKGELRIDGGGVPVELQWRSSAIAVVVAREVSSDRYRVTDSVLIRVQQDARVVVPWQSMRVQNEDVWSELESKCAGRIGVEEVVKPRMVTLCGPIYKYSLSAFGLVYLKIFCPIFQPN